MWAIIENLMRAILSFSSYEGEGVLTFRMGI